MRNMSFALTTQQILDRTKTVTRRTGWANLKPGTLIRAVRKSMGLRPGEQLEPLAVLCVVDVTRERLGAIEDCYPLLGDAECEAEGFPELLPAEFVEKFCRFHKGCTPETIVTRIEFRYVPGGRLHG